LASLLSAEGSRKENVSGLEGMLGGSNSSGCSIFLSSTVARVTGFTQPSPLSPSPSPSASGSLDTPSPSVPEPSSELTPAASFITLTSVLALFLVRLDLSARISPTSDLHIASKIDHSASAMRRKMGVEDGGSWMDDVVGFGACRL
jgi:hypothetical protein